MSDSRHRQLSRIYGRTIEDEKGARDAIAADPGPLASALFEEAAESDDVTSLESARDYLGDRLAFFAGLIEIESTAIRERFEARLAAWR